MPVIEAGELLGMRRTRGASSSRSCSCTSFKLKPPRSSCMRISFNYGGEHAGDRHRDALSRFPGSPINLLPDSDARVRDSLLNDAYREEGGRERNADTIHRFFRPANVEPLVSSVGPPLASREGQIIQRSRRAVPFPRERHYDRRMCTGDCCTSPARGWVLRQAVP